MRLFLPPQVIRVLLFAFFTTIASVSIAQEADLPMNRDVHSFYDKRLNQLGVDFHTDIKPYRMEEIRRVMDPDSATADIYFHENLSQNWFYRKLRKESLFNVDNDDLKLHVDPVFNFEFGKDLSNNTPLLVPGTGEYLQQSSADAKNLYVNTRGFNISGSIGSKVSFQTSFYENQARFVNYLMNFAGANTIVPGQGNPKTLTDQSNNITGYDYAYATGYVSYSPNRHFNFQLGQGKTFIGDGYRSLFLSDNAFSYPFLKLNVQAHKFKYMFMATQMQNINIEHKYDLGYHRKFGVFHYLSYNVSKRLNLGFFESVVWQATDTSGNNRGFDVNYLNPVIFFRPVEYSVGSPDNSGLGISAKYKVTQNTSIYTQIFLDEFKLDEVLGRNGKGWYANKQGIQIGAKSFDVFDVKNLSFQSEVNYVRPFTYSHYNPRSNYAHYNQSLADPLNTNFIEWVSFARYRYKSFFVEGELLYAIHGQETASQNLGNDIFKSYIKPDMEYGNQVGQGIRTQLLIQNIRFVYIVNPKNGFNIEFGVMNRSEKTDSYNYKTQYVYLGLRTALTNFYYDF